MLEKKIIGESFAHKKIMRNLKVKKKLTPQKIALPPS